MRLRLLIATFILGSFGTVTAEEVIDLEGTSIIGNRELPKVLYIVPWKKSQLPGMETLPIDNLVDEALAPIDRDEFQRQINFYEQMNESNTQ